jgi:hypothetical protein
MSHDLLQEIRNGIFYCPPYGIPIKNAARKDVAVFIGNTKGVVMGRITEIRKMELHQDITIWVCRKENLRKKTFIENIYVLPMGIPGNTKMFKEQSLIRATLAGKIILLVG